MSVKWFYYRMYKTHVGICTNQKDFDKALKHLKMPVGNLYINSGAGATTHYFTNKDGSLCCIICMKPRSKKQPKPVYYAMLAHEVMHVLQQIREKITGIQTTTYEHEIEAYLMQVIFMDMMGEI